MRYDEGEMSTMYIKDFAGHLGGQKGFGALADVRMVLAGTVLEDTASVSGSFPAGFHSSFHASSHAIFHAYSVFIPSCS